MDVIDMDRIAWHVMASAQHIGYRYLTLEPDPNLQFDIIGHDEYLEYLRPFSFILYGEINGTSSDPAKYPLGEVNGTLLRGRFALHNGHSPQGLIDMADAMDDEAYGAAEVLYNRGQEMTDAVLISNVKIDHRLRGLGLGQHLVQRCSSFFWPADRVVAFPGSTVSTEDPLWDVPQLVGREKIRRLFMSWGFDELDHDWLEADAEDLAFEYSRALEERYGEDPPEVVDVDLTVSPKPAGSC